MEPTPYAELNALLGELVEHAQRLFGSDLVGGYLVGSFAVGDADLQSDCDFLFVLRRPISPEQEASLRVLWAELPGRDGHWTHHLEGSYAQLADLAALDRMGQPWLFVDHGHRELEWSDHCNREVVRWSLHEHGVTLVGPPPATITVPVPAELIMAGMRAQLPTLVPDIVAWAPVDVAWTQRYLVVSCCRVLYSMTTGRVVSKLAALRWGQDQLDPRWRELLEQVRVDRARDWDPADPPRPGSLQQAYAFIAWSQDWAIRAEPAVTPPR